MATADLTFRRFAAAPSFDRPVLFLSGNDGALIESALRMVVAALKQAANGIDIEHVGANDIASDPARLFDLFGSVSLFGGQSALVISDVSERHAKLLNDFLASLPDGATTDQFALFASSSLRSKSKLLGAFASHPRSRVISCYDSGVDRASLRKMLAERGLERCEDDALALLESLSRVLDPARFDLTLEKLALLTAPDAAVTRSDVQACEDGDEAGLENDLAILLLSGDRRGLMKLYATQAAQSGDAMGFLAILSASLSSLHGAQLAKTGRGGGGRPLFWKVDKALGAASARTPDLVMRLENAVLDAFAIERRSRSSGGVMTEIEVERLLLRLSGLLGGRSRASQ